MKTLRYGLALFGLLTLSAFFEVLIAHVRSDSPESRWFLAVVKTSAGFSMAGALTVIYYFGKWHGKKELLIRSLKRRFPDSVISLTEEDLSRIKLELAEEGLTLADLGWPAKGKRKKGM